MIEPLEFVAELLVKYFVPIGNLAHKYKTKITAIGLLKSADMTEPIFYIPYYERLMSYKLLVKNLMDNFKLSQDVALRIFAEVVWKVAHDENIQEEERHKSPLVIMLILLLNPPLEKKGPALIDSLSKNFLTRLNDQETCFKVAKLILDRFLTRENAYDELAQRIVKKCLTGIKQEEVITKLEEAVYNFFVYAYFDQPKRQLRYEITYQYRNTKERIEPFFNVKMVVRSIISRVGRYRTNVNIFGTRITNYEEIKELFSKYSNIAVMFF